MGILSRAVGALFGMNDEANSVDYQEDGESEMSRAEQFIREQTALYRHYCIEEVQIHVEQFTGVRLDEQEATAIVQAIRDENGMGPIEEYNQAGYVDRDEPSEQHGGLLGWLFGR